MKGYYYYVAVGEPQNTIRLIELHLNILELHTPKKKHTNNTFFISIMILLSLF